MYVKYSRHGSWHLESGIVSRGGMILTLCGRWAPKDAPTADSPGNERSCETCYRNREIRERDVAESTT